MNSIETLELTRAFGSFVAVDRISVTVREGEIYGFLGANGAGKTTAIRMLCGLLLPTSGSGRVAGFDIIRETALIRTRIGYMSQRFGLYPDLSVRENLLFFGSLYNLDEPAIQDRSRELSVPLDLADLIDRKTGSLPWGWQQRVALACAILHRPRILFLDEPTGSVDPLSRRDFWDLLKGLAREGTTLFVTTHHMDEAEYCDRVSIMIDGRVAAVDTPANLKTANGCDTLNQVFIKLVEGGRK